jgi:adenylosuccinate synthase
MPGTGTNSGKTGINYKFKTIRMKVDVLLGLQWGDEGKGKVVDVLTPGYDVMVRFQGGPNAGHSLEFGHIKHVLHIIPSGIFHKEKINIIGNGVVIDPIVFAEEIKAINNLGINAIHNLFISRKAHLIMPTHRILDKASEVAKGGSKIGSTLRGIGPAYSDKTGRNGIRVGDILLPDFREKYDYLIQKHKDILRQYSFDYNLEEYENGWFEGIEILKKFSLVDSEYLLNQYIADDKAILAEGAQGTMLDIDFGSYPYVTSSNTITAGACTGTGVAPNCIGDVFGIVKAYCTRVGSGPFATELMDETGEWLRKKGNEYGATTGRSRRCGWLDIPALKYSVMINGITKLILTKPDVLTGLEKIKACTAYKIDGQLTTQIPFDTNAKIEPVYTEFKGWSEDLSDIKKYDQLPESLKEYIAFIENEVKTPVFIVSVGPDRKETITRN